MATRKKDTTTTSLPPSLQAPIQGTKLAGSDFLPTPQQTATVSRYRYWVGVTPDCPVENLTIGGISWPKINERLIADPRRTGEKRRLPVIGAIVWIDKQRMQVIKRDTPLTVMRLMLPSQSASRHMETISDNVERPPSGHVITIPSPQDIEDAHREGRAINHYHHDAEKDVPAARYMFAQLCEDQENPQRGEYYPDTLEKTGFEWPEEL